MSSQKKVAGKYTQEACRRWPSMSSNALAKYLHTQHPAVFRSKEDARTRVRYCRGTAGEFNRTKATNGSGIVPRIPLPQSEAKPLTDKILGHGKWLLVSDIHVPFHDRNAVEAAIKDGKKAGCKNVLMVGDIQDCEALSIFVTPGRKRDFCKEVETTIDFLDWIRGQFSGEIIWMPGNHEERLEIYYARNAPFLADLPTGSLSTILDVESRSVELLERRQRVTVKAETSWGDLSIVHGHTIFRGAGIPVSPARSLILKSKANSICGHMHRTSYQPERTISRRPLACWSLGCLCDLDPDYNPDVSNWDHGHGFLIVDKKDWEYISRRQLPDGRIV